MRNGFNPNGASNRTRLTPLRGFKPAHPPLMLRPFGASFCCAAHARRALLFRPLLVGYMRSLLSSSASSSNVQRRAWSPLLEAVSAPPAPGCAALRMAGRATAVALRYRCSSCHPAGARPAGGAASVFLKRAPSMAPAFFATPATFLRAATLTSLRCFLLSVLPRRARLCRPSCVPRVLSSPGCFPLFRGAARFAGGAFSSSLRRLRMGGRARASPPACRAACRGLLPSAWLGAARFRLRNLL